MSRHDETGNTTEAAEAEKEWRDARISALYRDLPEIQPSADTDALIQAAARRAVKATPVTPRRLFSSMLPRLTATAALLILGVGLVVQWQQQPQDLARALDIAPAPVASPGSEEFPSPPENLPSVATAPPPAPKADTPPPRRKRNSETAPALADAGSPAPAPKMMREQENAVAVEAFAAPPPPSDLASHESLRRESLAERSDAATRSSFDAAPAMMARKAVTARPPPSYQRAMQSGDWASAWQQLEYTESDPQQALDHDLLSQLLGNRAAPRCQQHQADLDAAGRLLCDTLLARATGHPLPPGRRQALEESNAATGARAYRLPALRALLE